MKKKHDIQSLAIDEHHLVIRIDGTKHVFSLEQISPKLLHATDLQREAYRIAPSGYGIHWDEIDEDLSIDGLLGITHEPDKKSMST